MSLSLNYRNILKTSDKFNELLKVLGRDPFTDPKYYPPRSCSDEEVARYFIFMVAIDHRTSRYGPFEGYIDGEFFHGADALYRLGMKKFNEDPNFFSPEHMSRISTEEVKEWLLLKGRDGRVISIWDPEVRAELLRDLGCKLIKYFKGSVLNLIRSSNYLIRSSYSLGIIDLLKAFKAYSDPVEKKSYLLIKFLSRRGLFNYLDPQNSEVPVDNHLTRIALRLGFIDLPSELRNKIIEGKEFTHEEDIELRLSIRSAYKVLAKSVNVDPLILDDLLWLFGRKCCTYSNPVCSSGSGSSKLCRNSCPFQDICPSSRSEVKITEHNFRDTFYY